MSPAPRGCEGKRLPRLWSAGWGSIVAPSLTSRRPGPGDTCGFCLVLCAREVPSGLGLLPGAPVPGQGVDTTGPEAPDAGAATSACPVFPPVGRALASSSLLLEASREPEEGSSQKENACPVPGELVATLHLPVSASAPPAGTCWLSLCARCCRGQVRSGGQASCHQSSDTGAGGNA